MVAGLRAVNEATRHKVIWGWLRLLLADIQLTCAPLAAYALLIGGVHHWLTWTLIIGATFATVTSRLLYR
jgi:hypothetical protein